jgi:kinesin family protein C2/C3
VCIFAYGQTGSGKTHTMSGTDVADAAGRGINYRALDDLFGLAAARASEVSYAIRVQMLEIYNEALRDLLAGSSGGDVVGGASASSTDSNRLDILSTQPSGCNVPGATQVAVSASAHVLDVMRRGAGARAVGRTKMNDRSSRSHQVLTVIVDGVAASGARSHGCLHLIDLAGSERVARSEAQGE